MDESPPHNDSSINSDSWSEDIMCDLKRSDSYEAPKTHLVSFLSLSKKDAETGERDEVSPTKDSGSGIKTGLRKDPSNECVTVMNPVFKKYIPNANRPATDTTTSNRPQPHSNSILNTLHNLVSSPRGGKSSSSGESSNAEEKDKIIGLPTLISRLSLAQPPKAAGDAVKTVNPLVGLLQKQSAQDKELYQTFLRLKRDLRKLTENVKAGEILKSNQLLDGIGKAVDKFSQVAREKVAPRAAESNLKKRVHRKTDRARAYAIELTQAVTDPHQPPEINKSSPISSSDSVSKTVAQANVYTNTADKFLGSLERASSVSPRRNKKRLSSPPLSQVQTEPFHYLTSVVNKLFRLIHSLLYSLLQDSSKKVNAITPFKDKEKERKEKSPERVTSSSPTSEKPAIMFGNK